jgi:YD repeat-containing protein
VDKYSVYGLQYDLNGNIETLERKGPSGDGNGYIDDLTYSYNGNQLIKVEDASGIYNNYDFNNGVNETTEYIYDANGNMTEDKNKSITVEYSYLNLPVRIIFDDNRRIEWTYTASGAKLRKTVYDDGALSYTKDYTGGFVYTNSLLEFFSTQATITCTGTTTAQGTMTRSWGCGIL